MYNRTILVVDDEMDILEMIQSIFIRAGFTNILTAVSGREALKICFIHDLVKNTLISLHNRNLK